MVKIRLMRVGMKGAPSYRVVVADARSPRDGRIVENIGWYNPRTEPSSINIDADRAKHWLSVGAQPTDSVRSLLERAGIVARTSSTAAPAEAAAGTTTTATASKATTGKGATTSTTTTTPTATK